MLKYVLGHLETVQPLNDLSTGASVFQLQNALFSTHGGHNSL